MDPDLCGRHDCQIQERSRWQDAWGERARQKEQPGYGFKNLEKKQSGRGPENLLALNLMWQEAGKVYPAGGSLKVEKERAVETISSRKDGGLKAQERRKKEEEEKGRKSKEAQGEKRIQRKGVVEEVQRFHQQDLPKRRRGKARKEGRTYE